MNTITTSRARLIAAAGLALLVPLAPAAYAGTGAPNGSHYTLNIHGVPKGKTATMTGNDGRSIFVPLYGKTNIYLSQGPFQVLDANGTDANGASFQLPAPDPTSTGSTTYSVYVRALGKPGGKATATSCMTDTLGTYCSTEQMVTVRGTGKSKFTNVSAALLTVCLDTDGNGTCDTRVPLFNDTTKSYLWDWDNQGLRLAQLRFYPVSTTLP